MANKIRVGLEDQVEVAQKNLKVDADPLNALSFGKTIRQHVKEFGALFGAICFGVAAFRLYKGRPIEPTMIWLGLGLAFSALGYFAPRALHPVWKGWMKFAHYLSIVMTTVILGLAWCIGFIPMALLLRILKIRVIDKSYDVQRESYWVSRDPKYDDFARLEQQY